TCTLFRPARIGLRRLCDCLDIPRVAFRYHNWRGSNERVRVVNARPADSARRLARVAPEREACLIGCYEKHAGPGHGGYSSTHTIARSAVSVRSSGVTTW